ncbi:MAG TPA: mechanosensitive ion channel [Aggregatilineales bacterium]|nr:mechanosensitive ion channel [Aggregatilineales bacterium]HQA66725.1 mechanosensitive ion channel [Aggregatilineales bacterium]HQE18067.1 mechanosensitive ion channel [Aggregatilineales bacterium]
MEPFAAWFQATFDASQDLLWSILGSIAVIVLMLILRSVLLRVAVPRGQDAHTQYRWRKVISYSVLGLGVLLLAVLWLPNAGYVAALLGLFTAGLAIALQDPLTNITGWLFILSNQPFSVGDRIEIDGCIGDVIDIRVFQFTMLEVGNWIEAGQSTGRIVHIPNRFVFTHMVQNFTEQFDYIWHEIPVFITLDSNWQKAKTILTDLLEARAAPIAKEAMQRTGSLSERYLIVYNKLTPTIYTRVHPHAIRLTLRFLTPPRQRRLMEHNLWEDILTAFAEHPDIAFAPTQRISTADGSIVAYGDMLEEQK